MYKGGTVVIIVSIIGGLLHDTACLVEDLPVCRYLTTLLIVSVLEFDELSTHVCMMYDSSTADLVC